MMYTQNEAFLIPASGTMPFRPFPTPTTGSMMPPISLMMALS